MVHLEILILKHKCNNSWNWALSIVCDMSAEFELFLF